MAGRAKQINATPKLAGYPLDCLRDQPGWKASGAGWTNTTLDVTVEQIGPQRFRLTTAGADRVLTSATGCLLLIDQLARAHIADVDTPTSA